MNLEQKDRIGPYLRPHLGQFIFDELSENYLKRAGMTDILSDSAAQNGIKQYYDFDDRAQHGVCDRCGPGFSISG